MTIQAIQHIRRMRGGAQSHLMRCADGHHYVVKFLNNPQHPRVLVNDWLGTRLAEMIGLPVPVPAIVDVHPWLVEHTPDLRLELCGARCHVHRRAVVRLALRGVAAGRPGLRLPARGEAGRVRNIDSFAGVLALDKWTCNADGRQVAFWRRPRERKFTATFIDQGYFFNAGEWSFPDAPLRGVFGRNDVYAGITGWDSFEPWLSRIESFSGEFAVAAYRTDSSGVVRLCRGRTRSVADAVAGAPFSGTGVDSVASRTPLGTPFRTGAR